jgi:putative DNA primase/helicase
MKQLDTSLLKVTSKDLGNISTQYGLTVSGSNGSVSLINKVDLKLDTEFDTEHGTMSLEQFKDSNHQKVRCQAKFRPDSTSWNGYLGKHKDGSPFHYDNGTHIKYVIPKQLVAKGLWSKHNRPLTDTGNAERFVDLADGYCWYIPELSRFIVFINDMWGYASVSTIELATKTVARSILIEAAACSNDQMKDQLNSWQKYSESRFGRKNMLELVRGEISLSFSKIDENKDLIGCKNGVVDLHLQKLITPDRDNFVVSKMCVSFDPGATAPRFERFIDEITSGDKQVATYIQCVFGMMLLGRNPKQIMLMLVGHGSNGKSLLLETMLDIFGDYGISVEPELFLITRNADSSRPRPEVVKLAGKRLCITSEPPKGLGLNENLIKRLTGSDTLSARIPYAKEEVSFRPNVVPIMSSNHDVRIEGTDHGIWRRIKQVPFNAQFEPDKEKGLDKKLLSERDGIFNWLLEGVKIYLNDGLIEPQVIADNTKRYRSNQDVVSEWITDYCIINQGDEKQKILYGSYFDWCISNNLKPLESRDFHTELRGKGYAVDRSRNGKPVIDLKLK